MMTGEPLSVIVTNFLAVGICLEKLEMFVIVLNGSPKWASSLKSKVLTSMLLR